MEFNENANRRVYCIDLDNTLTNGELFWKKEPTVRNPIKDAVVGLYKKGNIVIIHTARQWELAPETIGWLIKNRIPFHGIMMGKGGSDFYVDDKHLSFETLIFEGQEGRKDWVLIDPIDEEKLKARLRGEGL